MAFALASLNRLEGAEKSLRNLPKDSDRETALVAEANHGMIAMRRGNLVAGEEHYRIAIAGFRQEQNPRMMRSAQAYFAREAAKAGHPKASELVSEAKAGLSIPTNPVAARVIKIAEELLAQSRSVVQPTDGRGLPSKQSD